MDQVVAKKLAEIKAATDMSPQAVQFRQADMQVIEWWASTKAALARSAAMDAKFRALAHQSEPTHVRGWAFAHRSRIFQIKQHVRQLPRRAG